jgi:hypothetical protein
MAFKRNMPKSVAIIIEIQTTNKRGMNMMSNKGRSDSWIPYKFHSREKIIIS